MSKRSILSILSVGLALVLLTTTLPHLKAQNSVTITLAVQNFTKDTYSAKLIGDFEAANPGVTVQVINADVEVPPLTASSSDKSKSDINAYLDAVQKYVSAADVVFVNSDRISPEATRAGYFLDLSPLANQDSALNANDFYPTIWQSFQWDKGIWALPFGADVYILTYDPAAFDKAGLAYPSEKWTIDDLSKAVRALSVKDAQGNVTTHGIDMLSPLADATLFRSLIGQNLFDSDTVPNVPHLSLPAAESVLDAWELLNKDGLIGRDFKQDSPMNIGPAVLLAVQANSTTKRVGVLLPGGKSGLDVQGFAVSAGTPYKEQAYALAKFLTTRVELTSRFVTSPARQSMVGVKDEGQAFRLNISPEVQDLINKSVASAIPLSDLRYVDYLSLALRNMLASEKTTKLDAKSALQDVENEAVKNQQAAATRKDKLAFTVATPVPVANVANGKITLKFGITAFASPLPNQDKWDALIKDFTSSDPQVGKIDFQTGLDAMDQAAVKYDCFYLPFNGVQNGTTAKLLNLDPFISADPAFDKTDVVNGVLPQLQRDNKTWGYPVDLQPATLKYDAVKFDKVGAKSPQDGWTVNSFNDALKVLKVDPKDPPVFADGSGNIGAHLLVLVAAFGGVPLDYRTTPPTINFTDPKTVDAIRQVLDLAKKGYIKYNKLASLIGGPGGSPTDGVPILTDVLSAFTAKSTTSNNKSDPYKQTTYPKGTQFGAASYDIGTAYISATAQNPEACYRWIKAFASSPTLLSSMPARRSVINDPALASAQGPDAVALYKAYDTLLQDPSTVALPSQTSGGASLTGFLVQYWLFQAFDKYVLDDGDLATALQNSQDMAKGFQDCAANLPPIDQSDAQKARESFKKYGDCATKVDPSLKPIFALIG